MACSHDEIDFDYGIGLNGDYLCKCENCGKVGVWEWEEDTFDNSPDYIENSYNQEVLYWF